MTEVAAGGSGESHARFAGISKFLSYKWLIALIGVAAIITAHHFSKPIPWDGFGSSYALCTPDEAGVYTVDEYNTVTQCVVVHQEHIVYTGSLRDVKEFWKTALYAPGEKLNVHFTPEGSMILPGISDSHGHIMEYGEMKEIPLDGTKSIAETVQLVREAVEADPDLLNDKSRWVYGGRWDHTSWSPPTWPSAHNLEADPVLRGRKIVLTSYDCHAMWVSPAVLERVQAGLPKEVEGGVIVRDANSNPTEARTNGAGSGAQVQVHPWGVTSIHDAGLSPVSLEFFTNQTERGLLPIRIYAMTFFDEKADLRKNMPDPIIGAGNGRLTARSFKIFADGALRTAGAYLHQHYHDKPDDSGFMRLESLNTLFDVIPLLSENGWQVNVHAVGDRANGIVLDAFEEAFKTVDAASARHRLEHAQFLTKADIARIGKLGVIASIQPAHVIGDMWYAQDRLGPQRIKGLYPFRSIIDGGARITLGTDFPVEEMNPFNGFYAAVTRLTHEGTSPHGPNGWFPEQRLTRTEALRGMTIDPAYASFTDPILGSLVPGKLADIAVLNQDIMRVPVRDILNTKAIATIIDGRLVYGNL